MDPSAAINRSPNRRSSPVTNNAPRNTDPVFTAPEI